MVGGRLALLSWLGLKLLPRRHPGRRPRPVKWCKNDHHVIHRLQLAAASSGTTSFSSEARVGGALDRGHGLLHRIVSTSRQLLQADLQVALGEQALDRAVLEL